MEDFGHTLSTVTLHSIWTLRGDDCGISWNHRVDFSHFCLQLLSKMYQRRKIIRFIKIITVKCRPVSVIYYTLEHAEHVAGNMLLIAIFKFLLILISRGGDTKRSNLRTYKKCFFRNSDNDLHVYILCSESIILISRK